MRRRTARRLAWVLGLGPVALYPVLVWIAYLSAAKGVGEISVLDALWGASFLPFPIIGALIASRRPENPVGWLFCAATLPLVLSLMLFEYARYALVTDPGSLPFGVALGWVGEWLPVLGVPAIAGMLILFPTGRVPHRFWRWPIAIAVVSACIVALEVALKPGRMPGGPGLENPMGIEASAEILSFLAKPASTTLLPIVALCLAAPVMRFRRSRAEERQQLKWFLTGVVTVAVTFAVLLTMEGLGVDDSAWSTAIFVVGASTLPVCIAVAMLKYRLYDIDLVINRTLVYAVLTALLALAYFAIVVALQNVIPAADESDLTIAGSTLAVAALFRPLRARVQAFINRRFYRSRYDAQRTLESFSARLREDVDLDHLSGDLLGVVRDTMQPAHASLWLRETRT